MTIKDYFKKAEKEGWAIGQFNFSTLETLKAIIRAAQNLKSPVIVGTSEGESGLIGLKEAVSLIRAYQKETGLPIVLNLDHGQSLDYIKEAVKAGYQAVHFDGSKLPLIENIAITKRVVALSKKKKILTEGEVGMIGSDLTDPEEAEKFVKETKIDNLTINIGTWHGLPAEKGPKVGIDFQRLKEIKNRLKNIPLVLHGGSGVPESHIKEAIKSGIVKININTELRMAYTNSLRKILQEKPEEIIPYKYLPEVIFAVQKIVEEKIKLFGSDNKI